MTKPAGAITRSEGVLQLYDEDQLVHLPIYTPRQQGEFMSTIEIDGVEVRAKYVVEAGYTLTASDNFDLNAEYEDAGAASGDFDIYVKPKERYRNNAYKYSGEFPNTDGYPLWIYLSTKWSVDGVLTGDDELIDINYQNVQTKDEDEGSSGAKPTYELFSEDSTGTHIYEAGMPLSAYSLMVMADNLNALSYVRQAFTVPMWAESFVIE